MPYAPTLKPALRPHVVVKGPTQCHACMPPAPRHQSSAISRLPLPGWPSLPLPLAAGWAHEGESEGRRVQVGEVVAGHDPGQPEWRILPLFI